MSQMINTPEGCKYRQIARFLHPSGAPLIDIYQAGAQRTLGAVAPPLLPVTPSAAPALHRETRAVTGIALPRMKTQAGIEGRTIGARLHGPQWDTRQLPHAMRPSRALHDAREIHHLLSVVHHHCSRWASKPATDARCDRTAAALIAGGLGSRRCAVAGHWSTT